MAEGDDQDSPEKPRVLSIPSITPTLNPNASFDPSTDTFQPSNLSTFSISATEVQVAGIENDDQTWNREGGPLLNGASKAFKFAERVSGVLPVVGGYVGAVARVGSTIVEMVQVSGANHQDPWGSHLLHWRR